MADVSHLTVLLEEAVAALAVKPGGAYVDGTFGRGGHSRRILADLGDRGRLIALDRDPEAIRCGLRLWAGDPRVSVHRHSFAQLDEVVAEMGMAGRIDGVLLDLGVSSPQLDDASRGFSFLRDGPLDMRMDPDAGESAADWLARVDEREIARVLRDYGEERYARRIARAITAARAQRPLRTTAELAALIAAAVPRSSETKHPATRSFQALRIEINGELDALRRGLDAAFAVLRAGGRLVVISFHSLEDRIVKRFMRAKQRGREPPRGVPVAADQIRPELRVIGRAVRASAAEVAGNPRARSAVMRVAERLA